MKQAVVTTEPKPLAKVIEAFRGAKSAADFKAVSGNVVRIISLYDGSSGALEHFARPVEFPLDYNVMWNLTAKFERNGKGVFAFPVFESVPRALGITKVNVRAIDRKFSYSFLDDGMNRIGIRRTLKRDGWQSVGATAHIQPGLSYRGLVRTINAKPSLFGTKPND